MNDAISLLTDFLIDITHYNSVSSTAIEKNTQALGQINQSYNVKVETSRNSLSLSNRRSMDKYKSAFSDFTTGLVTSLEKDDKERIKIAKRLYQYKKCLNEIKCAAGLMNNKALLDNDSTKFVPDENKSIDEVLSGLSDFWSCIYSINNIAPSDIKKHNLNDTINNLVSFYRSALLVLENEIAKLEKTLLNETEYYNIAIENNLSKFEASKESILNSIDNSIESYQNRYKKNIVTYNSEKKESCDKEQENFEKDLLKLQNYFTGSFPPNIIENEIIRVLKVEPDIESFECRIDIPSDVKIGDLYYNLKPLDLSNHTKQFLLKNYPLLLYGESLSTLRIPYMLSFDEKFALLFKTNNNTRNNVSQQIQSVIMRLFMQMPPNKINFTFFDPITLGETFAIFTRLVDVDDQTSKVINGKIWTLSEDIEEKLRVTTEHIANITQRYLQGKYKDIKSYNEVAGQNAEPYKVLVLMDFPAGLSEKSLRRLEQIITTGPKCGVFSIIISSEEQYAKIDKKRLQPLVDNIIKKLIQFEATENGIFVKNSNHRYDDYEFQSVDSIENNKLSNIISTLKNGIKTAERIVIPFRTIVPDQKCWFQGNSSSGLLIPIGMHGANNIQNLSFGVGGSHHALIAGQTGSGKSSLLHTIIMSALIKYPADQLQIFLVDFKRGVEFKIYANYSLENFKVIAIESEREFGCSVLEYLDKEQSRRADKFKRINVDNVEKYRERTHETLPRILLIIDEFHVLFSKDTSDIYSKKSAAYLEQIIRQGRAFGIHIILASQTMSNFGGINYAVWGQVGVRIALKCPRADAKFVLGSDNDAVDLLSGDNPGQAVYNSDGGNVVANSVFRVAYLEQSEQDKYLKDISENEPRFNYPETRVMLSNVEDNIYNPLQKFADGKDVSFTENKLIVGEPLKLVNNMKMNFKKKQGSNLLVIGNDEEKARTMFTFAALSLSLHKFSANGNRRIDKPAIYLFDYAPMEDFDEKDILDELRKRLPSYIKYIPFDEADEYMKELYDDFLSREKGNSSSEDTYMFIYGLQRARNLRSNDIYKNNSTFDDFDEFGSSSSKKQNLSVKPYEMFLSLLQRGSSVGINCMIWEDNFKVFMNNYADMLPNFDMRIAFTMPDEDSINFIEEVDGSKISENGAVYNYNGNQKFRPYRKPDLKWIDKITQRME